ncbi:MAG: ketoacyl-ACP synthase III [Myxococcales bacterium]|nr:ketoacyl-ACP synthase III [Myxococcales bacterium]USN50105.1 MAG: ketoacyl-ACP synthase III [Myxococcales bacterium]
MFSEIVGTGSYLPKKIITNTDLSKTLDTSDEWISSRTGIKQRHCADIASESCSQMGTNAAKKALDMAGVLPTDLDLIIVGTCTADYRLPSAACLIQEKLGAHHAAAFDISAACAGSIYGLNIAHAFIKSGIYKNILLVTSETLSCLVDWRDRNTAVLFGDGASAAVLSRSTKKSGFIDIDLYSDGSQQKNIWIPSGGSLNPVDEAVIKERSHKIHMKGQETFKFAVRALCDAIDKLLSQNNVKNSDISFAVPHQANLRIIEAIAKRMELPMERFLINLDKCANTSAASLLLAYDEANRAHKINEGDLILMLAIGAGFVWGAGLYQV